METGAIIFLSIMAVAGAVQNGADRESREHHAESVQDMLGKNRVFD